MVYAKAGPEDVIVQITATNRGPDPAPLHLLPTLWLRNTWWAEPDAARPALAADPAARRIDVDCPGLGAYTLAWDTPAAVLVTENETNHARLDGGANASPYVKDGINDAVVDGRADAVNPAMTGTKAAVHLRGDVAPGESLTLRLRLAADLPADPFGTECAAVLADRRAEADAFYASLTPPTVAPDAAEVMRQALAGMIWSKQYYGYDLDRWLGDHGLNPLRDPSVLDHRNARWSHMLCGDVISMPDAWEYPWFAAWDLAFHTVPLAMVDPVFAREQIRLLLGERYLHPSGQIPAYEWNFSDVNPPVHALATLYSYRTDETPDEASDHAFLVDAFGKLLMNFTWWVNRKDPAGANAFEGGFLGLDNIAVFDRSAAQLPGGGRLEQADGTAWMALYCQTMLELALTLVRVNPALRGHGAEVRPALLRDRGHDGARRRHVGRGRRLLLRPAAAAGRLDAPAARAVDGRPAAAVRGHRDPAGVSPTSTGRCANGWPRTCPGTPTCSAASPTPGSRASGAAGS